MKSEHAVLERLRLDSVIAWHESLRYLSVAVWQEGVTRQSVTAVVESLSTGSEPWAQSVRQ